MKVLPATLANESRKADVTFEIISCLLPKAHESWDTACEVEARELWRVKCRIAEDGPIRRDEVNHTRWEASFFQKFENEVV